MRRSFKEKIELKTKRGIGLTLAVILFVIVWGFVGLLIGKKSKSSYLSSKISPTPTTPSFSDETLPGVGSNDEAVKNVGGEVLPVAITSAEALPATTSPGEVQDEWCRNKLDGYSVRMVDGLFTNFRRDNERCVFFAFSPFEFPEDFAFPDYWDTSLVPLIVDMENSGKEKVVESLSSDLGNVKSGSFSTLREYDAVAITGTYPLDGDIDIFSGKQFYFILVPKNTFETLEFILIGSFDDEKKRTFEELARSVEFF